MARAEQTETLGEALRRAFEEPIPEAELEEHHRYLERRRRELENQPLLTRILFGFDRKNRI